MDKDLADQVAGIAARVVASGAISANGHGNVSVRVPEAEEMYFTAGPAYAAARRPIGCWIEAMAMFGLQDGTQVRGILATAEHMPGPRPADH
jgi:hypothetical protein